MLERLGIVDGYSPRGAALTREFSYGFADARRKARPRTPERPGSSSVRRAPLDALLLEVARAQATVDVAQPASASEVTRMRIGRVVGLSSEKRIGNASARDRS